VLELGLDACAENPQRRDQRVELVQRVGATRFRVDVELEIDAVVAVRDLEDRPRLEVVRSLVVVVVAVGASPRTALARVLAYATTYSPPWKPDRFRNHRSFTRARYGMPMLSSFQFMRRLHAGAALTWVGDGRGTTAASG